MTYNQAPADTPAHEQSVTLHDRAKLAVSGVTDVRGFNDAVILLTTSAGDLTVRGENLHIDTLDLDSGVLAVTGRVSSLEYSEPPVTRGLWGKLFERVES